MGKDSGAHIDLDVRSFRRYPREAPVVVFLEGRPLNARTVDYSLNSVGIVIASPLRVTPGDDVALDIDELGIHQTGRVVRAERTSAGLRAGVLKTGPVTGSLRHYLLPDILIGLQRTLKTGILDVHYGHIHKRVYFRNGTMIFATSDYEKDRLGDVLLKSRKMTRKQYDRAAEIKRRTGADYTEILVHMGYLKPSEVMSAKELQARRIIGSLFAMRDAEFEFVEGPLPSEERVILNVPVANLIYRAVKRNADVELLEKYLLDSVVDFSSAPLNLFQSINFTTADKTVLSYVDGRTSIRDISRLSPRDHREPLKTIYALLEARFLEIRERDKSPGGIPAGEIFERKKERGDDLIDEIDKTYSGYEDLDYYRILELCRNAPPDKVKKAYYRAAKKYHPDLHPGLPEDMKQKLLEIFTYISNAYLTLIHPQKREEYDRGLGQEETDQAESPGTPQRSSAPERDVETKEYDGQLRRDDAKVLRNAETARSRFEEGRDRFRKEKFDDAARLFAMAIYFDGSVPEYHYFYGRALAMRGDLKEAVKALNRANELKPMNADVLAELGHIYMNLGFPLRAKGYFDKAIECNPLSARAKEGIEMLGTRKEPQ